MKIAVVSRTRDNDFYHVSLCRLYDSFFSRGLQIFRYGVAFLLHFQAFYAPFLF